VIVENIVAPGNVKDKIMWELLSLTLLLQTYLVSYYLLFTTNILSFMLLYPNISWCYIKCKSPLQCA